MLKDTPVFHVVVTVQPADLQITGCPDCANVEVAKEDNNKFGRV